MKSTRMFVSAAVVAVLAPAAALPAGGATTRSATTASAAQNLTITATGILRSGSGGLASGAFELQGASGAETDLGKLTFTEGSIPPLAQKTPEGLMYVPLRFPMTFTGKHGTLVIRISARQFDVVRGDDSIATGTWSVVRGTGRYAGLKGGGALVGMQQAAGRGSISDYAYQFRFQGRVSKA
jgi:hypothetical protein